MGRKFYDGVRMREWLPGETKQYNSAVVVFQIITGLLRGLAYLTLFRSELPPMEEE